MTLQKNNSFNIISNHSTSAGCFIYAAYFFGCFLNETFSQFLCEKPFLSNFLR